MVLKTLGNCIFLTNFPHFNTFFLTSFDGEDCLYSGRMSYNRVHDSRRSAVLKFVLASM